MMTDADDDTTDAHAYGTADAADEQMSRWSNEWMSYEQIRDAFRKINGIKWEFFP